jgi:hypothetical protein
MYSSVVKHPNVISYTSPPPLVLLAEAPHRQPPPEQGGVDHCCRGQQAGRRSHQGQRQWLGGAEGRWQVVRWLELRQGRRWGYAVPTASAFVAR